MPALARLQTSDCSNPELDLFTRVNGILTDVAELSFQIFDLTSGSPVQVYPVSGRETIDVDNLCPTGGKISTGRYVAEYTPPAGASIGQYRIDWFFKLTATSPEQTSSEEFTVLPSVVGSSSDGYTTVQDLRDEGVPTTVASDARLQKLIARASSMVERYTGRFFGPRTLTLYLDGSGTDTMFLEQPIIRIDSIELLGHNYTPVSHPIETEDLIVYNRHLQGMTDPDDRNHPKFSVRTVSPLYHNDYRRVNQRNWIFPEGDQNVKVTGIFGYTDYDGTEFGKVPDLIELVTGMLVVRELSQLYNISERDDDQLRHTIKRYRQRDQEIETHNNMVEGMGTSVVGAITGDPAIDRILTLYMRPPKIGVA